MFLIYIYEGTWYICFQFHEFTAAYIVLHSASVAVSDSSSDAGGQRLLTMFEQLEVLDASLITLATR
jgi:hypothetical protein